jgi:LPXTG-motif cell wall-anchored protein
MKIFNKRNALLGWVTWLVGKRVFRRKARAAVPTVEGGKPNRPAIAAALAALGGGLLFWRRRKRPEQPTGA